jgi:hypothetical protein
MRVFVVLLLATGFVGEDAKAVRVLAQARQALGGEARLAQVRGLTATGQSMRMMPDGGHVGELRIDLQWPDRMLRTDAARGPGSEATFVMLRGLDGSTLLRNSKILNGGPGHRMSRPPLIGGSDASAVRYARDELTRLAIALVLTPPASAGVEVTYGGQAESPDGKADVIAFSGANGFAARLFLDVTSHKPLMMTWRDLDPRVFVILPGSPPGAVSAPGPAPVEIAWYFEDYRPASGSGLQLPHRISRSVAGTTDEEWTFKSFAINPTFKADAFSDR